MDIAQIDVRLRSLDRTIANTPYQRKKGGLRRELEDFLSKLPNPPSIKDLKPNDVRRFLVHKDAKGKTKIHAKDCPLSGQQRHTSCPCPRRLASGTVETVIGQLKSILVDEGLGTSWDPNSYTGNPAYAPEVSLYLKAIQKEQSEARVTPRQAVPLFANKLRAIAEYIDREANCPCENPIQKFVLLRDQAFLKVQFFAGDRTSDLGQLISQDIRALPKGQGYMVRHTTGKTFTSRRTNTFVLAPCQDSVICPVKGLQDYFSGAVALGIDLSLGHLFRLTLDGSVLEQPVTYDAVYERMKHYLTTLGLYEGETPHSLRGGCAITLGASADPSTTKSLKNHIGWFSEDMPRRYSRADRLVSDGIAKNLSKAAAETKTFDSAQTGFMERDYDSLPQAFQ